MAPIGSEEDQPGQNAPVDPDRHGFALHKAGGSAPIARSSPAQDAITILRSTLGLACKRILAGPDGSITVEGYPGAKLFQVFEESVSNITELSAKVKVLEALRNCLVVRGAPRSDLDLQRPQHRRKINFSTPPSGRRWLLIDLDEIALPAGMTLQKNVGAVCEYLIRLLPAEFHDASYHWQLSSSAGVKDSSKASGHLWFWLDRPIPDAPLKAWSKWWNGVAGAKIIDPALFNDVQAHYTAAPIFVGMDDPFAVRSGLVRKVVDEVALKLPRAHKAPVSHAARADVPSFEPSGGFETILAQIGDHPGGAGFHVPIIRAVASHASTQGREGTDIEKLFMIIQARALAADRSKHDDAHVEQMASRQHIIPAIEQALVKFAKPGDPRRKSRKLAGVRPFFSAKPLAAADASALLERVISQFFGVAV